MPQQPFAFPTIRQDANRSKWPDETLGRAPYKPLLLLAVLDLMEAGRVPENRIVPDQDLTDAFMLYWNAILPGHIQQFAHRPMILPDRECHYPAPENLAWHRERSKLDR